MAASAEPQNWMWVYMLDGNSDGPQMVLFQYERTRGGYHPKDFLEEYSGYLTTDGYQSYHGLLDGIRVTGRMPHSRRRFEECLAVTTRNELHFPHLSQMCENFCQHTDDYLLTLENRKIVER